MRPKRAVRFTRLNIDILEDRLMLAAVGSFIRDPFGLHGGGNAHASASARADVTSEELERIVVADDPIWSEATAIAVANDEYGFAFSEEKTNALVPVPIGYGIAVAQVSANDICKTLVTDTAGAEANWATGGPSAVGDFYYEPDPLFQTDLYYHGHLFVAALHGESFSGNGDIAIRPTTIARAGDPFSDAEISHLALDQWHWSANVAGQELEGYSTGGGNRHFTYTIPITSIAGTFVSRTFIGIDASSGDGFAQSLTTLNAAAWGYVTAGSGDVTPGDIDYDGDVDDDDYLIWADGLPQADITVVSQENGITILDGIVDEHDYAIWAANVDGILVSTLVDENDGNYTYGDLSLREAIALAADVNHSGKDIIAFDGSLLGSTITLDPALGYLTIDGSNEVEILGPGADQLTINGNGLNVFNVSGGGSTPIESTISHVKLTGATGTGINGVAVWYTDSNGNHDLVLDSLEVGGNTWGVGHNLYGQLTITNSLLANNTYGIRRYNQSAAQYGASITISNCTVQDNGWGILLHDLDVSISNTEVSGNGYGITFSNSYNPSSNLTIFDSTIAENYRWGISIGGNTNGPVIANISNTTISTNGDPLYMYIYNATGLVASNATATLTNVTVTQNRLATSGAAAGVYAGSGATITMHNTIVADNYSGPPGSEVRADLGRDTSGSFSVGTSSYNLVGVVGNSGITTSQNNIILNGADAGLTALGDYGGRTRTHALLLTSLAIDNGNNSLATDLSFDQRGEGYGRIEDRNGTSEPGFDIDIGAFELALSELYG